MSLATGTRLGPYEIVAPIGADGIGGNHRQWKTRLEISRLERLSRFVLARKAKQAESGPGRSKNRGHSHSSGICDTRLALIPPHPVPQRSDMSHVMPSMPGVQAGIPFQSDQAQLGMPESAAPIGGCQRAK